MSITDQHQLKLCLCWHSCVFLGLLVLEKQRFSCRCARCQTASSVRAKASASEKLLNTAHTEPGDKLSASSSEKTQRLNDRSVPSCWSGSRKTRPENRQQRLSWIAGNPGGRAPGRTAGAPSCPLTIPRSNTGKRREDEPSWSRLVLAACFSRLEIRLG